MPKISTHIFSHCLINIDTQQRVNVEHFNWFLNFSKSFSSLSFMVGWIKQKSAEEISE